MCNVFHVVDDHVTHHHQDCLSPALSAVRISFIFLLTYLFHMTLTCDRVHRQRLTKATNKKALIRVRCRQRYRWVQCTLGMTPCISICVYCIRYAPSLLTGGIFLFVRQTQICMKTIVELTSSTWPGPAACVQFFCPIAQMHMAAQSQRYHRQDETQTKGDMKSLQYIRQQQPSQEKQDKRVSWLSALSLAALSSLIPFVGVLFAFRFCYTN